MKLRIPLLFTLLLPVVTTGCTFVTLKPSAEQVLVLSQERVRNCRQLGTTRVTTMIKFGVIARGDSTISEELARLARNNAVDMGGDTVSPLSKIDNGEQTFGIYRCVQ